MQIGRISYGVYLYHLFIPELHEWINQKFSEAGIDLLFNQSMPVVIRIYWLAIQQFILLLIICVVSWKFIENPINKLKKYFEHKKPQVISKTSVERIDEGFLQPV